MDILALVVSVLALALAGLAFARTGGMKELRRQLDSLGSKAEEARGAAANAIEKIENVIRGGDKADERGPQRTAGDGEGGGR